MVYLLQYWRWWWMPLFQNVRPNINDVNKWWRKRRKSVACQTWNLRDEMLPSSRLNHLVVWFFHIHSTGSMRTYLAFLSNCLEFQYQLKLRLNLLGRRLLLIDLFFLCFSRFLSSSYRLFFFDFATKQLIEPFAIKLNIRSNKQLEKSADWFSFCDSFSGRTKKKPNGKNDTQKK